MEWEVPKGVQASRQLNIEKGYIYFELETSHSIYIHTCVRLSRNHQCLEQENRFSRIDYNKKNT